MPSYIALVSGKLGAYVVVFPDVPGCTAGGNTMEEALLNARVALGEWLAIADSAEGFGVSEPRTRGELCRDPNVIEQMKETGAVFRAVEAIGCGAHGAE
jgi:predicted RNase H-like HicB family nuclease